MHGRHDGDDAFTKTFEEVVSKASKVAAVARVYIFNTVVFHILSKLCIGDLLEIRTLQSKDQKI